MRFTEALIVCIICCIPLAAQLNTASLSGKVVDERQTVIPNAKVALYREGSVDAVFQTETDDAGKYFFEGLAAGEYTLKISAAGFYSIRVKSVSVSGRPISLPPVALFVSPTDYAGDGPLIDHSRFLPAEPQSGTVIGSVRVDPFRPGMTLAELYELEPRAEALADVDVILYCDIGKPCAVTKTNEHGEFKFESQQPGKYMLWLHRDGYYPIDEFSVIVQEGVETVYNPVLAEKCWKGDCNPRRRPKTATRIVYSTPNASRTLPALPPPSAV